MSCVSRTDSEIGMQGNLDAKAKMVKERKKFVLTATQPQKFATTSAAGQQPFQSLLREANKPIPPRPRPDNELSNRQPGQNAKQ